MQSHYLRRAASVFALVLAAIFTVSCTSVQHAADPVTQHGALAVQGNRIVNKRQEPVTLAGPSLFWGNKGWHADGFYHRQSVAYAKNDWGASIIRVAMGVDEKGGILEDPEGRLEKVHAVVKAAIDLGMYVIIDWHSHHAEDHTQAAVDFFALMARTYGQYDNIIYEIYNEPLRDVSWSNTIKPYALQVIAAIREYDPDNIIVVGTPTWAQDVDDAADDPITEYSNIAYTLHFYAGTHGQELRDKAQYALDKGIALMVTEWGTVDADGNGAVAYEETLHWLRFMKDNHLSHCNWSFHNKDEGASVFKPGTPFKGHWQDKHLTPSGLFVKRIIRNWPNVDAVEPPVDAP